MIIDSRLSSRNELLSYVCATQLFERIIEPKTLQAGYQIASQEAIDTCIFGPSLAVENITTFLVDLNEIRTETSCAYIATFREGNKEEIVGVHAHLEFPCSKAVFNAVIIEAIMKANGGNPPASKKRNPENGELLSLKNAIEKLDMGSNDLSSDISSVSNSAKHESDVGGSPFTKEALVLAKALSLLEPQGLKFRPDGNPTIVTTNIIKTLIEDLFENSPKNPDLEDFKIELERSLYQWIVEACQKGRKTANLKLKENILNYFRPLH